LLIGGLDYEEAGEDDVFQYFNNIEIEQDYHPYPNKLVHLVDLCIEGRHLDLTTAVIADAVGHPQQHSSPTPIQQHAANGILDSQGGWSP
jgi:hypothetical protein